jgi:hypothetical protein
MGSEDEAEISFSIDIVYKHIANILKATIFAGYAMA